MLRRTLLQAASFGVVGDVSKAAPPDVTKIQLPPGSNFAKDRWTFGHLLMRSLPSSGQELQEFSVQAWSGTMLSPWRQLDVPGAAFRVHSAATDAAGRSYFASELWGFEGRQFATAILRLSAHDQSQNVIRLPQFLASSIAVSPDGGAVAAFGADSLLKQQRDSSYPTFRVVGLDGEEKYVGCDRGLWGMRSNPSDGGPNGHTLVVWSQDNPIVYSPYAGVLAEIIVKTRQMVVRKITMPSEISNKRWQLFELVQLSGSGALVAGVVSDDAITRRSTGSLILLRPGSDRWEILDVNSRSGGFLGLYGSEGEAIISRRGRDEYSLISV